MRFIDSFKFMASSLDKLVSNLDSNCFQNTSKIYDGNSLTYLRERSVPVCYMNLWIHLKD